jgi:hypothetical protein
MGVLGRLAFLISRKVLTANLLSSSFLYRRRLLVSEDQVQVSAYISHTSKKRLDEFARESGLKKGYILETALSQYIDAAEAIPAEYLTPSTIVVSNEDYDWMVDRMLHPEPPPEALKKLMRGELNADQAPPGF